MAIDAEEGSRLGSDHRLLVHLILLLKIRLSQLYLEPGIFSLFLKNFSLLQPIIDFSIFSGVVGACFRVVDRRCET